MFAAPSERPSSPVANGVSILPPPREVGGASDVVAPPKTNQKLNYANKTIPNNIQSSRSNKSLVAGDFPFFFPALVGGVVFFLVGFALCMGGVSSSDEVSSAVPSSSVPLASSDVSSDELCVGWGK